MLNILRGRSGQAALLRLFLLTCLLLVGPAAASVGDRLPEFQECVAVCKHENCGPDAAHHTPIPLHRRLLLWTCPAECDYTCQHIVTARRTARAPPQPVVQFHGKWPFRRLLGLQEPLSVLFSLGNLAAHYHGLRHGLLRRVPRAYPLRRYYVLVARLGIATWLCSAVFHARDFALTEQLDYFAAAASVLFGMYYTVVRVFRLDRAAPRTRSVLRAWTGLCVALYVAHVGYLKLWRWDYTYNMAANVAVGAVQNLLWCVFSWRRYRETGRAWAATPAAVVAWVMMVMSLELLDFAPLWGSLDAHSLWHLGTIAPTVLMYK
ncbi:Per1-domain-containing protein [Trichocladium antarcticum]|uniref:Post-GPI attachment to proteins factor 3 n=1 Tax=Trichocladium antarcticum TaxID=1450529 RepID=A0AAN6UGY3_9PEZI|nr:Per1-domain-containing protein [Trichocladium antarcticum]